MTSKTLTARIEVFRPGTFKPMEGAPITYSAADLRAIADAYGPETAPAPIVIGHPDTDAPAFGWVDRFDYDTTAGRLFAELTDIEPAFADLVKAGRFKKVSMAYFAPGQSHNPVPGTWYPKHVGFLGAAAPAVAGLKNAKFAAPADAVFTASFGERGFEETAGILRGLRDYLIEKFGLEDADRALPGYRLEWLNEIEITTPGNPGPVYSAAPVLPEPETNPTPAKEPQVSTQPDPAFAEREADLTAREKRIADREAQAVHTENLSFAAKLVEDGRLIPASQAKVVAILDALPGEAAVSFAEGSEKLTPAAALREVLEAQPKVVSFGELNLPEEDAGAARGYRNSEFISHLLFPRVSIPNRSMRVLKFGKEAFRMMNTRRAPGADKKRVQYGYASDPVALIQYALEGVVPVEHQDEAQKVPGIDLGRGAIDMVLNVIDLGHEYEAAQLARTPGNYAAGNRVALTGGDRWTSPTSDPTADIDAGKEAIRQMIGRYGGLFKSVSRAQLRAAMESKSPQARKWVRRYRGELETRISAP